MVDELLEQVRELVRQVHGLAGHVRWCSNIKTLNPCLAFIKWINLINQLDVSPLSPMDY